MTDKLFSQQAIHDDDRRFDRLVDGELSPEEYRALIASLDDEPSAWRRCGLAFLEAQALTGELGNLRRTLSLDEKPLANLATTSQPLGFNLGKVLAIAASFVIAFGLGILAPQFFVPGPQDLPLAGNISSSEVPRTDGQNRHQALRPIGNVHLVMDGPGGESVPAGEVPVYDVGQDLDRYLSQEQPALAPELVQLLRERGHGVEQQRQYVPFRLEDGRQVVVPLEGYQITPVRGPAY